MNFYLKRLLKLADFLEKKVVDSNFGLMVIVSGDPRKLKNGIESRHKCGTIACAMGYCPLVFPRLLKYKNNDVVLNTKESDFYGDYNWGAIKQIFNLTEEESEYLFMPNLREGYITRKHVIKRIRNFVREKENAKN